MDIFVCLYEKDIITFSVNYTYFYLRSSWIWEVYPRKFNSTITGVRSDSHNWCLLSLVWMQKNQELYYPFTSIVTSSIMSNTAAAEDDADIKVPTWGSTPPSENAPTNTSDNTCISNCQHTCYLVCIDWIETYNDSYLQLKHLHLQSHSLPRAHCHT